MLPPIFFSCRQKKKNKKVRKEILRKWCIVIFGSSFTTISITRTKPANGNTKHFSNIFVSSLSYFAQCCRISEMTNLYFTSIYYFSTPFSFSRGDVRGRKREVLLFPLPLSPVTFAFF
jgi:hypothetical protein